MLATVTIVQGKEVFRAHRDVLGSRNISRKWGRASQTSQGPVHSLTSENSW